MKTKLPEYLNYGCLMLDLNIPKWDLILSAIKPIDVWAEQPGYAKELNPHVTILYGFKKSVNPLDIKECVYAIKNPIKVYLTEISLFENELFDVVKFDIKSPTLHKLNEIFSKFPHVKSFPKYEPHSTIAYVKKGEAAKYRRKLKKPLMIESNTYTYTKSSTDKKYTWTNDKIIPIRVNDIYYSMPGARI